MNKIMQDKAELQAMADFYGQQYAEVYFVRDMLADCIIAVECAPANTTAPIVERATGRRNIFGYKELFYTTRLRLDTNARGERMVGYESASGNDTRLAKVEQDEVPTTDGKTVLASGVPSIRALSPFERSQLQATVALKQASAKTVADYESYVDSDGRAVERFETFEVIRMK